VVVPSRPPPPIIVGGIGVAGAIDGIGSEARFSSPSAIAVGSTGDIYIADMGNNTIRRISSSGAVITLAGMAGKAGEIDSDGSNARFTAPSGVSVDNDGNVYVAEFAINTIRKISPDGSVSLLAGSPGNPGWKDAKGDNAHFRNPWSVAVDRSGNVFVADKDDFVIRKITPDGLVSTIAGQPGAPGFADGNRETARFQDPHGIAVDQAGIVYVTDPANQAVRQISTGGDVKTIAILPNPRSVAVDSNGTVFVTDSLGVHKIAHGKVELLPPLPLTSSPEGPFAQADGIAVDSRGILYIVDTGKQIICWQPAK